MKASPILLQRKYARIVELYAKQTGKTIQEALDDFYNSLTYDIISHGISDMHCMADQYLVEELIEELKTKQ